MQVGLIGRGQVVQRTTTRAPTTESPTTRYVEELHRREAVRSLDRLQTSVNELQQSTSRARRRGTVFTDPVARSDRQLLLDLPSTPTRLRSVEEINTVTTSFETTSPAWTRGSTAPVTLGGVYDGSSGTDTIRVRIANLGANWRVDVQDSNNNRIDRFDFPRSDAPGIVYDIANGMTIAFGVGTLNHGDRFWLDVDHDDPQAPNTAAAFDAVGPGANLEPGMTVTAGSFTINGFAVVVDADDSIDSVLAKITAQTDVTAVYDGGTESVILAQTTDGPDERIVLGPDTSGFLDAVKLTGAAEELGTSSDIETRTLDSIATFAGVTSGTITINGTAVSVDVAQDTLIDVLNRIETNLPGVSAGYLRSRDTVFIRGLGRDLDIDDGGTGLLEAIHIRAGRHRAARRDDVGVDRSTRADINRALASVAREVNELLELSRQQGTLLAGFESAVSRLLETRDESGELEGLGFGAPEEGGLTFTRSGAMRLERSLRRSPDEVLATLLGGDKQGTGFISELDVMVRAASSISERFA